MISIVKIYRLANKLYKRKIPIIPSSITWFIRRFYSSDIPHQMEAGANLHLGHGGLGIVIHPRCIIGRNVTIAQQVTIGGNRGCLGVPKIGNNVYVGPGAKILGEVVVGNNVIIGANTVLLKSTEDNVVVAGVPAKVIRKIETEESYMKSKYHG